MAKSLRRSPTRQYDLLVASVEGVADRWRAQYPESDRKLARGESVKDIQDALDALKDGADPKEADDIIGNQGWTHPRCECCNEYVQKAAQFGTDNTVTVCLKCMGIVAKELAKTAP